MKRAFSHVDADVGSSSDVATFARPPPSLAYSSSYSLKRSLENGSWQYQVAARKTSRPTSRPSSTPASRMSSMSPVPTTPLADVTRNRHFAPDASIVLIGFRGSGKSTLALMTANYLGRRIVEADDYWFSAVGCTRADFRKSHTVAEYRYKEMRVCDSMLQTHTSGCVIVCGPGSIEGAGQALLQEYAKTHPIIRVHRDARSIHDYLRSKDEKEIMRLLGICRPRYNGELPSDIEDTLVNFFKRAQISNSSTFPKDNRLRLQNPTRNWATRTTDSQEVPQLPNRPH